MDAASKISTCLDELDSKDTKRRWQGLDKLEESLRQSSPARDSWQQVVAPLVRTLRDNNFKVVRASLKCLESLVGHVKADISPFLSTIIPAVVECLGNLKPTVQEKGIDFLLAVSSPAVNGARDTIAALNSHFRHKNWRVREKLVTFLGRAAEVDGVGVAGRPVAALAGILADALNDSACQVRQASLSAAGSLVELMGESMLAQLEQRGVRNAQLASLRLKGVRRAGGSNIVNTPSTTSRGPPSPVVAATPTPPPRSRGAGADPQSSGIGNVSGSASAGLRHTVARRKPLRSAGGGGFSSPPATVSSPGLFSGCGEDSAFSGLEPLAPVKVCAERDVRREVENAKAGLEHNSDWQQWVGAMRRLAGVALGGAAEEFPALLVGLVRASVQEMVGHKVSENRSAVAREACRCVAVLARCLTDHFGALAELWLPELLRNTTRAVVVAAAGDEAARAIFGCTKAGFPRLLSCLVDTARNKSAAIRRRCLDYAMLALARWSDAAFDRHLPQLRNMIAAAVADADSSNRATARRAYWVLMWRFPELAQSVMDSLNPSMQRHVLREDREFDVEVFVEVATAAAEDPQPALGEREKGRDVSSAMSGSTVTNPPSTGHISSSAAATRRKHDAHLSSTPTLAPVAIPSCFGGERTSKSSRSGTVTTVGTAGNSNYSGGVGSGSEGGSGSGVMTSMKAKVDRVGVSSSNISSWGGGGGCGIAEDGGGGGVRVVRPSSVVPSWKARGKTAPQDVKHDTDSAADKGKAAGTVGALRVPCGNAAAAFNSGATDAMVHHGGAAGSDHYSAMGGAQRVARRPLTTAASAGVTSAESRTAERDGVTGGGGVAAGRVAGRHKGGFSRTGTRDVEQHQQQRVEGNGVGETADPGSSEALREVVGPAVLDRREVLRKMDLLVEQAGFPHWAARLEAFEGLLKLLTAEADGKGGQLVLESRAAARRLESAIAEHVGDAHFKVSSAALRLFGGLVEAHPGPIAGHASALLPSVFPSLADAKEPVRLAASRALDTCRAAYPSNELCAALCPRVLELVPGRARTGLLEFLTVLVPHSASYLSDPGHMQALTQRVAAALVQSPPPVNWDGGLGDSHGGPTSAGAEASAAIRLLTALFHVDREAFAVAVGGENLPPQSAIAMRRALERSSPGAAAFVWPSPSAIQLPKQQCDHAAGAVAHVSEQASVVSNVLAAPTTKQVDIECGSSGEKSMPFVVSSSVATAVASRIMSGEEGTTLSAYAGSGSGEGAEARGGNEGDFRGYSRDGGMEKEHATSVASIASSCSTQERLQQQQKLKQERRPLASVMRQNFVGNTPQKDEGLHVDSRLGTVKPNLEKRQTSTSLTPSKSIAAPPTIERETVEVARKLISGLSPGASSLQRVEALTSLRVLADGEGVGGNPEFWPRYFGQVLTLLLDGAASASGRTGDCHERSTGASKAPSRRRSLFRVKHVQGVRCLAARRGAMFDGFTETVVERLVEICAGDPCVIVRCEVETCLADLAQVLDPPRFLAALTPLLFVDTESGNRGGELAEPASTTQWHILAQCAVLGALCALTPRLSSPCLLGALEMGSLMAGLEGALEGMDLEARRGSVMVFVEIYQVLEEALLPFLSSFPTSRLKLITMYIEQRRERDRRATGEKENVSQRPRAGGAVKRGSETGAGVLASTAVTFRPMR